MESEGFSTYTIMSSANSDSFASSFLIWMPFIFFLAWLLWLGLPIPCWIGMMKADILVLLLMLVGRLLHFAHWVWCWLLVSHIWPLLGSVMHPLFPLCWVFNHKWVLYIIKCFFHICRNDHVIFVFPLFIYLFKLLYCGSVTVFCIPPPNISPTLAKPTSLPCFHLPSWFIRVYFTVFLKTLLPTVPSPLPSGFFLLSMSLVISCLLFSFVD